MTHKEELCMMKRKIVAVDKLVRNKQRMESRNAEMSLLLEARQKELEEAKIAREESLEKFGEVQREVWKKEEEMENLEDDWKKKMKEKEEELKDKDNQIMKLRCELAKEKKEKDEAKEELETIKHTYVSIGDLLSRKRAGPTDLADDSNHESPKI